MSKELDYIADLERENRLLGERCNQLLKDKGELTDQIADIKANCDLAIEGRDVKIKELEQEIVNLNSTLDLRKMQLDDSAEIIKEMQSNVDTLQKKNAELELELTVEKDLHQEETNLHLHEEDYIKSLEQQIEKMKRHCNCKHRDSEGYCEVKRIYLMDLSYDGCDKWELED